jgi:hypothetical protein
VGHEDILLYLVPVKEYRNLVTWGIERVDRVRRGEIDSTVTVVEEGRIVEVV